MEEKILYVQMFGGFSMRYGREAIVMNKAGSSKSVRLLQMLLLSLKDGITKNELIENLYGWNEKADISNRNRNLNNLIYRLKGQLAACGLPEDDYVEINEGMCHYRSRIPVETDTQEFEELVEQAKGEKDEKREALLRKAVEMYSGELLPANQSDMWFIQKGKYYKKLYTWAVRELGREYMLEGNYKERLWLYSRAAAVYPFENWQVQLIRCNIEMYRYEEALAIYNETMELYARELGAPPTDEMQECFEEIELLDAGHKHNIGILDGWKTMDKVFAGKKEDIKRAIFEEEVKGAYYCTYPSFVDYCRLVVRAMERNKFSAVLMFLTLSQKGKKNFQKQLDLQEQMSILKSALADALRVGDAYTRYGNRHFILMLVKTEIEDCGAIFRRVEKAYAQRSGKGQLWYYADMTQDLGTAL